MAGNHHRRPGRRVRRAEAARRTARPGHAHAQQPGRHPHPGRRSSMRMGSRLRKTVLVTHVATSVGWLGALAGYLVLDITVATSTDIDTVRGAYVAMDLLVRDAIVPLALASVLIGIINALGTTWGLLRHYWVLVKLVLTMVATGVLLVEAPDVGYLANLARSTVQPQSLSDTLPHSIGGLLILTVTLVLSVFKPRGVTRYGWRKQRQEATAKTAHRSTARAGTLA